MEEKKNRIMLIGRSGAGKTTLCQALYKQDLQYHKTQTVQIFNDTMIDTPGEYLERRQYRGALMVTSADADIILFVQDATESGTMYPPNYSYAFSKHVLGVVTKCDLANEFQIENAKKYLLLAGAKQIFITSSVDGDGIDVLIKQIEI
ncbi:MAG: EutP/PduV family microcompartment system protein [Lachnospiraceae bacterium]